MNIKSFCKAFASFVAFMSMSTLLPCASAGTLGDAVDNTVLNWATGGDAPWFFQTATNHDGVDAAQSGGAAPDVAYMSSWIETSVTGRVAVLFWWKLDSDPQYYSFYFRTNGVQAAALYGVRDWSRVTVAFESGVNTLRWSYDAWNPNSPGYANAAWLDEVVVTNITGLKPTILTQPPVLQTVPDSYPLETILPVLVIGDVPMTFQWQRDNTNITEGFYYNYVNTSALDIWNATPAEAGNYQLVISNAWGMVTSAVSTVSVTSSIPFIWPTMPQDAELAQGSDYYVYVELHGTQPFGYQWEKNGSPLPDRTNLSFSLYGVTDADTGGYCLVVTNLYGCATSRVAQITVSTALPFISQGPSPDVDEVQPGQYTSFYVWGGGPQPLSYEWTKIGSDDVLSTWQGFGFNSADPTNSGLYRVVLANNNGSITSRVSVLAVAPVTALGVALDAPQLAITNNYNWNWWTPDVSGTNAHDGLCALRSPQIGDYDSGSFSTVVTGTNVSFWWRISAGAEAFLDFAVDGSVSNTISGETPWQQQTLDLPAGEHTLTWTFRKDAAGSAGEDAAWVDQLIVGAGGPGGGNSNEITNFTTGGDADWFLEITNVQSPPDAWQSGVISDDSETWLRAEVTGPGTLSFSWSVDSEEGCDYLRFSIDDVEQTNISSSVAWQQPAFVLGDGPHELEWSYSKDGSVSAGADAGWLDDVTWTANATPPALTLTEALDAPGLAWKTSAFAPWFVETTNVLVGSNAAQSGAITAGQQSRLQTTIIGPGTISFWWAVNCDGGWNDLEFDIDGDYQDDITGFVPWTSDSFDIGPGQHILTWTYYKNDTAGVGADAGWVDDFMFTPASSPTINWGPNNYSAIVGNTADFYVSASGAGLHYQWFKDSVPIPDATNSALSFTAATNNAGIYYVVVSNWVDSIESYHARLTVLVPPQITGQSPDQSIYVGSVLLLRVDATGTGPLSYQWSKDGAVIATTANPYYMCANAQTTNSGAYGVRVTSAAGTATNMTPITVTVQTVPNSASPGTVDRSFNFGLDASGANWVLPLSNGQLLIGGDITSVNGVERHGLARLNADGSLDLLWDPKLNVGASVQAILPQPGGGFLIGGSFTNINGLGRTNVARLNADGSPDASFNAGAGPNYEVMLMAAAPDGEILIAGFFDNVAGLGRTNLAKLTATGAVAPGFNAGTGAGGGFPFYALAYQNDRILLGGYFNSFSGNYSPYLMRLKGDGSFDPDFTAGNSSRNGFDSGVYSIAVQADGRVLVAGTFDAVGTATNGGLVRLDSNGLYDPTFTPPVGIYAEGHVVKILGNGQIMFAGRGLFGLSTYNNTLARLNPDGSVDNSFTTNGVVMNDWPLALDLTQDGHVVVAGRFNTANGMVFRSVVSLNSNGTLDANFRPGYGTSSAVQAIALQSDGKILIGGSFTNVDYMSRNGVARLLPDGSIDPGFNPGSGASSGGYYGPYVRAVTTYSNGCVLVGGGFTNFNGATAARLVRLQANGTVDASFSSPFSITGDLAINAVAVQTDGKILVGGNFASVGGITTYGIARLLTDGSVDTSFQATNTGGSVFVIRIMPSGQIYVGGEYYLFARLNSNGPRDSTFLPNAHDIGGSVYAMELQPDGRIVIGNNMVYYGSHCLARFNPDGTTDYSFYSGFNTVSEITITALALQPDGHLVVGGQFQYFNGYIRQRLARVNTDGSLDMLFDPKPLSGSSGGSVYALSALPDGRVLVGGQFTSVADRTMPASGSVTLGRDNLMALNTENPAVDALPVAPAIITQPQGANVNVYGSVTLSVVAVGTPTLKYQWYKNNEPMIGAVESMLTLNPICLTNAGAYYVTVGNSVDTRQSWTASVYVYPPYSWNRSSRTLTLNWNAVPGHTYRVLRSTSGDLAHPGDPAWTIEYEVTATSVNCWWTSMPIDLSSHTSGFYRLVDVTTP
jgi:uncharacterized delta-60 repeat protein